MQKEKFKYQVGEDSLRFAHEFEYSNFIYCSEIADYEIEDIAQQAADDFFSNHDGWEYKWPQDFYIYFKDKLIGVCEVIQEVEPVFYATIKDAPQEIVEAKPEQPTTAAAQNAV